MRINIYSNKFIYSQTYEFRVCSPREGKDGRLYVYTKTHLATSNDHVGNSSPLGKPCTILRTPLALG